jgi:hypothetical protein
MNQEKFFTVKYQQLFSVILVFSFLEQLYFLFSFIQRPLYSAFSLSLVFVMCLIVFKYSKFSYSHFFICTLLLILILFEGINNFSLTSGGSWVGTMLKLMVFIIIYFTLQSRQLSLVDKLNIFRNLIITVNIVLIFSTLLGILFNNFIILNGRSRFLALSHTSSLVACFSGFAIILNFYFIKYYKVIYSQKMYFFSLLSLWISVGVLFIAGSRQPVFGVLLCLFSLIVVKNKRIFALGLTSVFCALYLVHVEFITKIDLLVDLHQILHLFLDIVIDVINYGLFSYMDGSSLSRFRYFEVGVQYVNNNSFIFGAGLNSFPFIYMAETGLESPAPHNLVLSVLTQFGYLGLILSIFFVCWKVFLSLKYHKEEHLVMYIYILGGLSLNNPEYFLSLVIPLIYYFNLISTYKKYAADIVKS